MENFLMTAGGGAGNMNVGDGLAAMFGSNLPSGVSPKQMEDMWKMLDDMAQNDPTEYKKLIDEQMTEMKSEIGKEKEVEEKKQTIQSEAAFCTKMRVAKIVEEKDRKKKAKEGEGIKLFDFAGSQIKESFAESQEKAEPLEEPIIYLNVVYHDSVVPPLDKGRDIADPKNDREWLIIPMVFSAPKERKNIEGKRVLTYDCHINTVVLLRMKEEARAMRSITNYMILKFQEHVEDEFVIHKKSIKYIKKRRYKCPKGTEAQTVAPFVLPKEHDVR